MSKNTGMQIVFAERTGLAFSTVEELWKIIQPIALELPRGIDRDVMKEYLAWAYIRGALDCRKVIQL